MADGTYITDGSDSSKITNKT